MNPTTLRVIPEGDTPPQRSIPRPCAALGITRDRMGRHVELTPKAVARLEQADRLPASAAAASRLAQIQAIVALGQVVYFADGFRRFVATPLPAFGYATALQLIERGEAGRVLEELAATYEGVTS